MDLANEVKITALQAEVMARGLLAVARADKEVREQELSLIKAFYGDVSGGSAASIAAFAGAPDIEAPVLAAALTGDTALLFLKTCVLLAYADNDYGEAERGMITRYAGALKVGKADLEAIEEGVREFLMGQLVHLSNTEAQVAVARELKG